MATVTKKELVDRIAEKLGYKRVIVKRVTQQFLDEIIAELGRGNPFAGRPERRLSAADDRVVSPARPLAIGRPYE